MKLKRLVLKKWQQAKTNSVSVITLILALVMTFVVDAAYQVRRPININGNSGQINQTYLWGEELVVLDPPQTFTHKGVDFPTATGTNVYAASEGTVVDIREFVEDDEYGVDDWGNYVLIRNHQKYWDKSNGARSFVYSMYLHLQEDQVYVNVGNVVTEGYLIARSNNTSNSRGSHLHYQVGLCPLNDRVLETLQSSARSRNPELWLSPLANTGTAIGKVTDNGFPVGNLLVCGIRKTVQTVVQMTPVRTYSFTWANPDDLLGENFGTTDVLPGSWMLYAKGVS